MGTNDVHMLQVTQRMFGSPIPSLISATEQGILLQRYSERLYNNSEHLAELGHLQELINIIDTPEQYYTSLMLSSQNREIQHAEENIRSNEQYSSKYRSRFSEIY